MNLDKLEVDVTLFDASLNKNFGRLKENEELILENESERIADESSEEIKMFPVSRITVRNERVFPA